MPKPYQALSAAMDTIATVHRCAPRGKCLLCIGDVGRGGADVSGGGRDTRD
jgi:hypothetical protein